VMAVCRWSMVVSSIFVRSMRVAGSEGRAKMSIPRDTWTSGQLLASDRVMSLRIHQRIQES
jgi:hypothetical protein